MGRPLSNLRLGHGTGLDLSTAFSLTTGGPGNDQAESDDDTLTPFWFRGVTSAATQGFSDCHAGTG